MAELRDSVGNPLGSGDSRARPCRHKFCPNAGLVSASGMAAGATASVLRGLLKPLALLMFVATVIFIVRDLLLDTGHVTALCVAVLVALGAGAGLLVSRIELSLRQLRAVEVGLFVATAAHLLMVMRDDVLQAAASGDPGLVLSAWTYSALAFILLITTYAIFVPNTWQRAALLVVPMAMAPIGIVAYTRSAYPRVRELADAVLTPEAMTDLVLPLGVATVVALLGTALIARFRNATFQAHESDLYSLRKRIGAGGMGEVWLAEHRMLARPAAIKIIRPDILGDGDPQATRRALRRFEREARATAALRSPNTVAIYDYGVTHDGVFYYVMEYLDGLDLETLVNRYGPIPAARAIRILLQACASLEEAHRHDFIHRDVKPANIFVCRLGREYDFVKILDFGLVKEIQAEEDSELTVDGLTTGTPAYMAPEMALRDSPVSPATDIYSLGCVAYWLLTGERVFSHETPMAILVDHVKERPVPPSRRTELEIPPTLDEIILRCLAKNPGDRYPSMRELAEALDAVPLSSPAWDRERAEEWWRLHRPVEEERLLARAS